MRNKLGVVGIHRLNCGGDVFFSGRTSAIPFLASVALHDKSCTRAHRDKLSYCDVNDVIRGNKQAKPPWHSWNLL